VKTHYRKIKKIKKKYIRLKLRLFEVHGDHENQKFFRVKKDVILYRFGSTYQLIAYCGSTDI
jgi:hypothetical protein